MANVSVQKCRESGFPATLMQKISALSEEIRNRAYSLFEKRGKADGSDVEDWLNAEREIIWSPASELIDSKDKISVRLALPGFDAKDVEVSATPDSIVVQAESTHTHDSKEGDIRFCEFSGKTLFRRLDLPAEVDVEKITASLEKGILEITAPKATAKRLQVAA